MKSFSYFRFWFIGLFHLNLFALVQMDLFDFLPTLSVFFHRKLILFASISRSGFCMMFLGSDCVGFGLGSASSSTARSGLIMFYLCLADWVFS